MKDYVAFIFALYRRFPLFCADRSSFSATVAFIFGFRFIVSAFPGSLAVVRSPHSASANAPATQLFLSLQRLPTIAFSFLSPHPPRPIHPTLPFTSHIYPFLATIHVLFYASERIHHKCTALFSPLCSCSIGFGQCAAPTHHPYTRAHMRPRRCAALRSIPY